MRKRSQWLILPSDASWEEFVENEIRDLKGVVEKMGKKIDAVYTGISIGRWLGPVLVAIAAIVISSLIQGG